jgi:hypothetical protein
MAKSAVASAFDEILARTVVPTLKAEGFRKRGWDWSAVDGDGDAHRGVTAQRFRTNRARSGRFTVDVGVSFVSLGQSPPGKGAFGTAVGARLSWLGDEPHDVWFELDVDDPGAIERVGDEVDRAWSDVGLPFVLAATSPERLCRHLAETGNVVINLRALEKAVPFGDDDLRRQLLRRAKRHATGRSRWHRSPSHPHPLQHGLGYWADIVRQSERLHEELAPDERDAALAVRHDAAAGMLSTPYHSAHSEEDADVVAGALGVPAPHPAEMLSQPRPLEI